MKNNLLMNFTVDKENNKIKVEREFAAELHLVWDAWTKPELLEQWWAPKPWQAKTKVMNFAVGGYWLYVMVGPNGEEHWGRADYTAIEALKSFSGLDGFCDKEGNLNPAFPRAIWKNNFNEAKGVTTVTIETTYEKLEDLENTIKMGFKEGFTAALENLDKYLIEQFKLRNELKPNNMARVTSYLNFPGTTEQAFNFYKSVFGTEFNGKGIQRFGDIPAEPGNPIIADNIKKMVLHVELPILGGHILMATDAPKEMGMTVTQGNNMHICLEPATRAETKRLFDELSQGGTIIMPLVDMFFGAYFGQCTDKFGINWMFNCIEKK